MTFIYQGWECLRLIDVGGLEKMSEIESGYEMMGESSGDWVSLGKDGLGNLRLGDEFWCFVRLGVLGCSCKG